MDKNVRPFNGTNSIQEVTFALHLDRIMSESTFKNLSFLKDRLKDEFQKIEEIKKFTVNIVNGQTPEKLPSPLLAGRQFQRLSQEDKLEWLLIGKNSFARPFEEHPYSSSLIAVIYSDQLTPEFYYSSKALKCESIPLKRQKIIKKIKSYRLYKKGWDGYDGVPPLGKTIEDSIKFLEKLPSNCPLPYVSLAGDGEICFFWEVENIFIDIGFSGEKNFSYFARDKNNHKFFGDDVPLTEDFPNELMNVIYSTEPSND
ncbi:MAG: hypothetical protein JSR33_04380 [Proteobacteria bacterium]|nr:hypothetical protein [Pseudomonadota bacterium]